MNAPQPKKSNRWMILIAVVVIASLVGIFASYIIQQRQANPESPATSPETPQTPVSTQVAPPQPATDSIAIDSSADAAILTAPMPESDTLAREEMDRLQDEYSQLTEQKELLKQQITDSNKLIEMKEKYLADLQSKLDNTAA